MRFNPPPNWPPAPPGWVPDANWVPDPSWPPPPPGWPLWVDDRKSHKALWVALAAAVVIVVAVAAVGLRAWTTTVGDEKPSSKPDITNLGRDLLVDKSAFPDFPGGQWATAVNGAGGPPSVLPNATVHPEECADLFGDPKAARQTMAATVSTVGPRGARTMGVHLSISPDQRNVKDLLQKCQSFTRSFDLPGRALSVDVQLDPLDAEGVPPWAVGTVMTTSGPAGMRLPVSLTNAAISGYYRGVRVFAQTDEIGFGSQADSGIDPATAHDLLKLFNAQVEKLDAAR